MSQSHSRKFWQLGLAVFWAIDGVTVLFGNRAFAQIAPDITLGNESSTVTRNVTINGIPSDRIDGGAIRDATLFHSFQEFNVNDGRGVYFTNPTGIKNILSRVTGDNPSKILGTLGVVGGNANLFLINSNGIIFGANARLDLKGSFLATTANRLKFANDRQFSTVVSETTPLLTVSLPIGLQFGENPKSIQIQSRAPNLQVQSGQSLVFVGGEIALQGGRITAPSGRIELGSVDSNSQVNLNLIEKGWVLGYEGVQNFKDIQLSQAASLGANANGSIQLQGKRVTLTDGSRLFAASNSPQSSGTLKIDASDAVELSGSNPEGRSSDLITRTLGPGNASNIIINTGRLLLQDGATLTTESTGFLLPSGQIVLATGRGGDVTVTASKSVEISGGKILTNTNGFGPAGNVTIATGQLIIQNKGQVAAQSEGLDVNEQFIPATGRGGDLTLIVENLIVQDESEVSVSSAGIGDAGGLNIRANSIRLDDSGKLTSTTNLGRGGGDIKLQDVDLLLLRDNSEISTNATAGSGNGGDISIDTDLLIGLENSDITANAIEGRGGTIKINAQGIFGIEPRSKRSPETSDITAFSEKDSSLNGVIEINRPETDPNADLVILPAEIIDISGLVAQGCPAGGRNIAASQFVITGRGGLPPNPAEATRSDRVLADLGKPIIREERASATNSINAIHSKLTPLVEANSWIISSKGEVVLTATAPSVTSNTPWLATASCNGS